MKIHHKKTWIVVADGARARIFLNEGPGTGLVTALDHDLAGNTLSSHEIGSDRPGRTFSSSGPGRHVLAPPTDPHEHEEHKFIRRVAKEIEIGFNAHAFEQLILVAPPRALGDLRAELSPPISRVVKSELHKELTHLTPHQLGEHLADVIKV